MVIKAGETEKVFFAKVAWRTRPTEMSWNMVSEKLVSGMG